MVEMKISEKEQKHPVNRGSSAISLLEAFSLLWEKKWMQS